MIELVKDGDSWRYIDDEGRISKPVDRPLDEGHALVEPSDPEWLTGLEGVVKRLTWIIADEMNQELEDCAQACELGSYLAGLHIGLRVAESELARERERCGACGGHGVVCGVCHGTGKNKSSEQQGQAP